MDLDLDEVFLRLFRPGTFFANRVVGNRFDTSAMPSNEYDPKPDSKGASVWLRVRLLGGLADIERAYPNRTKYGVAAITARELKTLDIKPTHTPEECEVDVLKPAHYSLEGVTKDKRNKLLRILDNNVVREPAASA